MAKAGYAVYGIDHEGHGKSSGLLGYIPNFDNLVNDCLDYFTSVCETDENKKKLRFLWGESMGAAVALLMHGEKPQYWDGAVLVAPMCKIADSMKPHPIVIYTLKNLAKVIPTWKIVPSEDFLALAIKSPQLREEVNCIFANVYLERPQTNYTCILKRSGSNLIFRFF
eukprot:TRINITY_DN8895_c0_g1_i4.p1 TRINITY_DN8895_c0_g1~~TRINITY_DN8895_c0_g1_i4.p1  ORF type:complete len:168 (-),score=15.05 TRINITY_DN8895_c0_g1_i4:947-1450(-)